MSEASLNNAPLIAVLRGVRPDDVLAIAKVIYRAGIRIIEVPLNSPDPFKSIAALATGLRQVGAGTVLHADDVHRAHSAGGRLATSYGPRHLQALRAVLPPEVGLLPVGGIAAEHIADWLSAGAVGFGFGSELFRPEYSLEEIEHRAQRLVRTFREARLKIRTATRGAA